MNEHLPLQESEAYYDRPAISRLRSCIEIVGINLALIAIVGAVIYGIMR